MRVAAREGPGYAQNRELIKYLRTSENIIEKATEKPFASRVTVLKKKAKRKQSSSLKEGFFTHEGSQQ